MRRSIVLVSLLIGACEGRQSGSPDAAPSPDDPDASEDPLGARDGGVAPDGDNATPDGGGATPDGGGVTPDASPDPDASHPDGGTTCASPPGGWMGTARQREGGASTYTEISAEVLWTLVETTGCVDRLVPSGTATHREDLDCSGTSTGTIEPTDGEMIVDRTTNPATFELHGESHWEGTLSCSGATGTFGGVWAEGVSGAIDGAVIAGGLVPDFFTSPELEFRFVRTDAAFTTPETCSEPAEETWSGPMSWGGTTQTHQATVSWTLASTVGCVDRFAPAGTMSVTPAPLGECVERTYEPSSGVIGADDGYLEIDRSFDPPRFAAYGDTSWTATVTCRHEDGTTTSDEGPVGGWWALHVGELDGEHTSIRFEYSASPTIHAWTLTRP